MQISKRLELFVMQFCEKIEKSENKHPWYEMLQWKTLESSLIEKAHTKLKECFGNDANLFQNYVRNSIDVNKNVISEMAAVNFTNANCMTFEAKKSICEFFDIMDDDYRFNYEEKNMTKAQLYLHKLMIPITEKWRTDSFSESYCYIDQLDKLLTKYNIKYYPGIDMSMYVNSIMYSRMFTDNDFIVFDLIRFFERISAEYKKLARLTKIKEKKSEKEEKINKTDHSKSKMVNKYNEKSRYGSGGDRKLMKNTQPPVPIKKFVATAKPIVDYSDLKDLDNLKIQGLKEKCKKYGLDTARCKKRDDYVDLLLKMKTKC